MKLEFQVQDHNEPVGFEYEEGLFVSDVFQSFNVVVDRDLELEKAQIFQVKKLALIPICQALKPLIDVDIGGEFCIRSDVKFLYHLQAVRPFQAVQDLIAK